MKDMIAAPPLYIDLDGTLIRTDLAQEMLVRGMADPVHIPGILRIMFGAGRSHLKRHLAERVDFAADRLPYVEEVVRYATEARAMGRRVVLATAADRIAAEKVAAHLGVFDAILASEPGHNLKSDAKLAAIRDHAGGPFEYIGNSTADVPIWRDAARRGFVNAPRSALAALGDPALRSLQIEDRKPFWRAALKAMRPHQWAKNALVLLPLLLSHGYGDAGLVLISLLAFLAFSLCASGIYVINDLVDIEADRAHPRKCRRPFAAGTLSPLAGVGLATGLVAIGAVGGMGLAGPGFGAMLLLYVALTCAYSFYLKQYSTIDVVVLALLYTMRIVAGAVAIGAPLSPWLLNFSFFFFLSLAYLKRYIELSKAKVPGRIASRNYDTSEADFLGSFGIANGGMAILTLALYLNSDVVVQTYAGPELLWLICPLMSFWIYRTWLWARRGRIDDDPVLYALKDPVSRLTILLTAALVVAGRYIPLEGLFP
jgi:4-hydroxybenzoate polyprenyltransferase